MNYVCISIRWLGDRYHGKDADGGAEWPPSPFRLFQTLLATAYRGAAEPDSFLESFRWFQHESLPAPLIVAPPAQPGRPFTRFVPNNDSDKRLARKDRLAAKEVWPTLLLDVFPIHYIWPLPEAANGTAYKHFELLCDIARHVVVFGWGVDMAAADGRILHGECSKHAQRGHWFLSVPDLLTDIRNGDRVHLRGERWLPCIAVSGRKRWRIAGPGSLAALIERHGKFRGRLAGGFMTDVPPLGDSAFRNVGYRRSTDPPPRPFAPFAFRRPRDKAMRSFPATQAVAVASIVRGLAAQVGTQTGHTDRTTDLEEWVNSYVLGRGESEGLRPRFSYLPLPTIRPPGVLGDIRRVIIAEPPDGAGEHAAWAARALAGHLLANGQQQGEALLVPLTAGDRVLPCYVATAETWATVTPVVLPGSDDGRLAKAEKLFSKALRHAGYSPEAVANFEFRNVSFWPGGALARSFERPEYLKKGHWSVYHIRLRWRNPVAGPIAIGAGRHCGLGVFAAFD